MQKGYETFTSEEKWPKFTLLKRDTFKHLLMIIGYFLSIGILYLLSTWLKNIYLWPYSESSEGDFVLIEEPDEFFEVLQLKSMQISESSINFGKLDDLKKIRVLNI